MKSNGRFIDLLYCYSFKLTFPDMIGFKKIEYIAKERWSIQLNKHNLIVWSMKKLFQEQ